MSHKKSKHENVKNDKTSFYWRLLSISLLPLKIVFLLLLIFFGFNLVFAGKTFPNVYVAGVDISGLTPTAAKEKLVKSIKLPTKIEVHKDEERFEIDTSDFDVKYDLDQTVYSTYNTFRTGNTWLDTQNRINSLWQKRNFGIRITYDETKLNETISVLAGVMGQEAVYPRAYVESGNLVVDRGQKGRDIDTNYLHQNIIYNLTYVSNQRINAISNIVDPTLTDNEVEILRQKAIKLAGKSISLTFEFNNIVLKDNELLSLLSAREKINRKEADRILEEITQKIERAPQNPVFVFEGSKVSEFTPAKPGVTIEPEKTRTLIADLMDKLLNTDDKTYSGAIIAKLTEPSVTTEKVNDLGIKELIGRGTSRFTGSIPSRVFNVNLAATRVNGTLIAPGEEFSFNNAVGDISKLTGFKEAYVIQNGKTVLGDGGGVCQVSTTIFRAALNAGLPITERRSHAYRVGYYEQDAGPGFDATIYSPTTDFKFLNDTPGHILVQAYPDTKNYSLVFELYGTSDGRVATVGKPVTTGVSAPPEDSYVDDPTLPAGQVKQVEHKAWGATSTFSYKVERNGQVLQDKNFVSKYRPWQAVYLRGTGPAQ